VVKTERSGHAHGIMKHASKEELNALDGVIVVGGDGLFNEVLNGLVLHRHKANAAAKPQRTADVQTQGDGYHKPEQQNGYHSSEENGGLKLSAQEVDSCRDANKASGCISLSLVHHTLVECVSLPSPSEAACTQVNNIGPWPTPSIWV
jgi:hypothetical protein